MNELNGDAGRHSSAHDHARAWGTRRLRFWIESSVAGTSLLLALLTLVWRDWIEAIFGVEPDNHSGEFEWLIVAVLLVVAVAMAITAHFEWRRLKLAVAQSAGG
jgi:hypothetical protein